MEIARWLRVEQAERAEAKQIAATATAIATADLVWSDWIVVQEVESAELEEEHTQAPIKGT